MSWELRETAHFLTDWLTRAILRTEPPGPFAEREIGGVRGFVR
jgi:hypothetical protein